LSLSKYLLPLIPAGLVVDQVLPSADQIAIMTSPDSEHYPDAVRLLTDDMDYSQLTPGPADFVVIATQHKGDHQSLQRALRSGAGRIALVASRKRARLVTDYCAAKASVRPTCSG
jgi:xanthine/CO dehydrogenase XdhC/CoxF family maturation factor